MQHRDDYTTLSWRDEASVAQFAGLLENAFYYSPAASLAAVENEGIGNLRISRIGEEICGGLSIQRMGQWFVGKRVDSAVIRYVVVSSARRGGGVAETLLRHALRELFEASVPLALLYPSTQTLYHRVGFERAGTYSEYEMPALAFGRGDRPLTVTRLSPDEESLSGIYTQHARNHMGLLDRTPWLWRRVLQRHATVEALVFGGETSEGYVVFSGRRDPDEIRGHLIIHDVVALTALALRTFAAFVGAQQAMTDTVRWQGPPSEPLFCLLNRQHARVRMLHWMLRIVDVVKALEGRGYAGRTGAIVNLDITDRVLPENNGRFVVHAEDGDVRVTRGGTGRIRLDIRALAALFSGFMNAWQLRLAGLLDGDESEAAAVDRLFGHGGAPWLPDLL